MFDASCLRIGVSQGNHNFRTRLSARPTSIRDTVVRVRPPSLYATGHLDYFLAHGLYLLLFRERIGLSCSVLLSNGAMLSASKVQCLPIGSRLYAILPMDLPLEMSVGCLAHLEVYRYMYN